MADEGQREQTEVTVPGRAAETGAKALDITGGVLGLVVFVIGVVLVVLTYQQAVDLYGDIPGAVDAARVGAGEPSPPDADSADEPGPGVPAGAVVAQPGGRPLAKVAADLGLRFLALVLIGFLGFLVAAMGAKLAGAHRGKRT